MVCLITSVFGGRPGMISGAAGALAVVMVTLVKSHGIDYLFAAVVLMGIIQVSIGLLKLGKFIRLVPQPVIYGSIASFHEKFEPHSDPKDVVVDFKESRVADHSAIKALNQLTERYSKIGKRVCLKHLSPDCVKLLGKAGSMVEVNVFEDPEYTVVE